MKVLSGNNMATLIPPWAVAAPPSAYDPDCLSLESETIINHKSSITNVITRTHDALGRNSGFSLDDNYTVTYGYDAYGRFNAVTSTVQSVQSVASYSHLADSDLIESTTLNLQPATCNLQPHLHPHLRRPPQPHHRRRTRG